MNDNDLDKLFKSKLQHLEIAPAEKLWDGIALELNGSKSKNNFWPIVFLAVIIIAVLFACGLFIVKNIKHNTEPEQTNAAIIVHKDK